jgi:Cu(I)/Ag(I) efflux system membrane fusion protein
VDNLMRDKKVSDHITLFSPIRGTVTEKMVVQKAMVKRGEMLYRLANLESVWVYLDIYESDLPWVQYGQLVETTSEAYPGRSWTGRVWFINPVLTEESRTVTVLLNISNEEKKLKPGMYVSAVIRAQLLAGGKPSPTGVEGQFTCPMHPAILQMQGGACPVCGMALTQIPGAPAKALTEDEQLVTAVPVSAVLDSGARKLVYVERAKGVFVPVEITTGPRAGDFYPVLSGLKEGDRAAVRGNFLLDSQFQISGLPSLLYREGQAGAAGHHHGDPPGAASSPDAKPVAHEGHAPKPAQPQK